VNGAATVLRLVQWRRASYRMEPAVLRAFIPAQVPGTYLLMRGAEPVYVGRSDTCILRRLCTHEHATDATHVVWEPSSSPERAFRLEAAMFHTLGPTARLLNRRHPAKPAGYTQHCPFCGIGEDRALDFALTNTVPLHTEAVARDANRPETTDKETAK
jgi:hypothetical protein